MHKKNKVHIFSFNYVGMAIPSFMKPDRPAVVRVQLMASLRLCVQN